MTLHLNAATQILIFLLAAFAVILGFDLTDL